MNTSALNLTKMIAVNQASTRQSAPLKVHNAAPPNVITNRSDDAGMASEKQPYVNLSLGSSG